MIHLLHGIRTGGPSPIEGLIPYLTGFEVAYPDYGFVWELETRIVNSAIVGTLLPYVKASDILIGHSNGCAIAYEMMQRAPQVAGAVFINAALETNIVRPPSCPWIDVYFNPGDQITELAQIGAAVGVVDRDWGQMGHAGYSGTDINITNINCGEQRNMPIVSGHSDFFTDRNLASWGPYLATRIQEHVSHD